MSVVKSKNIYSIQNYCFEFLGFTPITNGEKNELRTLLDHMGYENLWDYPLDEIEHIIENELPVVLVDTTYIDDDCQMIHEFRWVQIP